MTDLIYHWYFYSCLLVDHHSKDISENVFGDCKIGKKNIIVLYTLGQYTDIYQRKFSGIFWKRANNVFLYRHRWNREWISWAVIFVVVLVASEPATRISATMQCFLYLMNVRNLIWVSMCVMYGHGQRSYLNYGCCLVCTSILNFPTKGQGICSLFSGWILLLKLT